MLHVILKFPRGIIRTLASICFSSAIGRWVDRTPNRWKALADTIVFNRASVAIACVLWLRIVDVGTGNATSLPDPDHPKPSWWPAFKYGAFAFIMLMEISEILSAQGNMLSMERDFVVTVAERDGHRYDLTNLNAVMRRIDLICKLVAPLLISIIISATYVKIGVLFVFGMSVVSCGVEIWCAKRVWDSNSKLRVIKTSSIAASDSQTSTRHRGKLFRALRRYGQDFKQYFTSPVWIPSISLALLHLSALSYGATFVTFLLNSGTSLAVITVARAVGSVVEISSTAVTPYGVTRLGRASRHGHSSGRRHVNNEPQEAQSALMGEMQVEDDVPDAARNTQVGLERVGLWGLTFQLFNLVRNVLPLYDQDN
jgi:iron-regulated transporter 1